MYPNNSVQFIIWDNHQKNDVYTFHDHVLKGSQLLAPYLDLDCSGYHKNLIQHFFLIISPLVSLMKDQTIFLRKFGISAGSIGDAKAPWYFRRPIPLLGTGRLRRFPGKKLDLGMKSIC